MVISGLIVGRVTYIPTIILSGALRDDAGHIEGVYYVALSLELLQNAFAKAKLPEGSRSELVDHAGQLIARHPDPEGAVG
jgi:hypothetical protein